MKTWTLLRLLLGAFTAYLSDHVLLFAVPLLVFNETGSLAASGAAYAIEWLPRALLLPFGGYLNDRIGSKPLIILIDGIKAAVCAVAFFFVDAAGEFLPILLGGVAAFSAVGCAQVTLAYDTILVKNTDSDAYIGWSARFQNADLISMVVGPVVAVSLTWIITPQTLLLISAGIYFVNTLNIMGVKISRDLLIQKANRVSEDFARSFAFLHRHPRLLMFSAVLALNNFMIGIIEAAGVSIVKDVYLLGDQAFGLLNIVAGIVGSCSIFIFDLGRKRISLYHLGIAAIAAFSIFSLLAAFRPAFVMFLICYGAMIAGALLLGMYPRSIRAKLIPAEDFGKVTSILTCINQLSLPLTGLVLVLLPRADLLLGLLGILAVVFCVLGVSAYYLAEKAYNVNNAASQNI